MIFPLGHQDACAFVLADMLWSWLVNTENVVLPMGSTRAEDFSDGSLKVSCRTYREKSLNFV
jgi:hypothetical protein